MEALIEEDNETLPTLDRRAIVGLVVPIAFLSLAMVSLLKRTEV